MSQIDRVEAMFTRAIELDDTYGAAYADRARVRVARFVSHADGNEANLAGARADIAQAQKYAGGTPYVLVRAAGLAFLVDRDLPRALGLIEAAEQVGPLDAGLLLTKGNFLMFDGRLEESLAVQAQAARLDPGNAGIHRYWVQNLAAAHRPREMLRVLADFDSRFPGRLYRGEYLFAFTGATGRWWDESRVCGAAARRTRRCRPSSTCCATRDGWSTSADAVARGGRHPDSRSTARSVRASVRASSPWPNYAAGSVCSPATSSTLPVKAARSPWTSSACRRRPGTSGGAAC